MHSFAFIVFLSISAFAQAGTQEECQISVKKDVETAVNRKMSKFQQDEIQSAGERLCLDKTINSIEKERLIHAAKYIEDNRQLDASYCGPDPDAVGRGQQCRTANAENEKRIKEYNERLAKAALIDKKIRNQEREYEALKLAKAQPNRKVDPLADAQQRATAAVAKVKNEIRQSMKDPDSVKFRNITTSKDGSVVCGEVNAKNSMGGYDGYKKFINVGDELRNFKFYEEVSTKNSLLADACEEQSRR